LAAPDPRELLAELQSQCAAQSLIYGNSTRDGDGRFGKWKLVEAVLCFLGAGMPMIEGDSWKNLSNLQ
jgi:hypothetical protein